MALIMERLSDSNERSPLSSKIDSMEAFRLERNRVAELLPGAGPVPARQSC